MSDVAIPRFSWTDAAVGTLKELWGKVSAAVISREIGAGSRNAVISKAHRLGLAEVGSGTKRGQARTPRPPRLPSRQVTRYVSHGNRLDLVTNDEPILPPEPEMVVPFAQRCALLDLTESKCRWPVGTPATPDFFFCGGPPVAERPYCPYHARVAYQPPKQRARRPLWRT